LCSPGYLQTDLIDSNQTQTAEWLVPSGEQQGLRRYVQTIRERFKLIALTVLVTTLAAALYVGTAEKTYEARATLLVTPVAYSLEAVPAGLEPLFLANPLSWLMELWRFSMLGTAMPPAWQVVGAVVVSLGVFLAGSIVFQRYERSFADLI